MLILSKFNILGITNYVLSGIKYSLHSNVDLERVLVINVVLSD